MAQYNTASTLSALHKEIYADSYENLIPEGVKFLKKVPFTPADKELGDNYIQPVMLSHEHGFSYGSGVFTLNASIAGSYAEAQVAGKSLLLRSGLSYSAAARMSNSKKAFAKWSDLLVGGMSQSFMKRLEIQNLYGGKDSEGVGILSAVSGASTTRTWTISTASFAAGIWAGSENMELDVYDDAAPTTKLNTNATVVITAVDIGAKQISVSGNATDLTAIAANDILRFRSSQSNEGNGLNAIALNTGTLYNISAATYGLWKANTHSASSATLTFAKLQAGVAKMVDRGCESKVCVMVSPQTWVDLQNDQASLRSYDKSYSEQKFKQGAESIEYHSQNGLIEIVPSIYVKQGEAFGFVPESLIRMGSTDVTSKMPGKSDDELYLQIPDAAGYELRMYTEQQLFCKAPAKSICKFTAIVNSN